MPDRPPCPDGIQQRVRIETYSPVRFFRDLRRHLFKSGQRDGAGRADGFAVPAEQAVLRIKYFRRPGFSGQFDVRSRAVCDAGAATDAERFLDAHGMFHQFFPHMARQMARSRAKTRKTARKPAIPATISSISIAPVPLTPCPISIAKVRTIMTVKT